jgi:hypothetical protein
MRLIEQFLSPSFPPLSPESRPQMGSKRCHSGPKTAIHDNRALLGMPNNYRDFQRWRGGRVAEGAPLLRAYTLTRIEGSNPFLSAASLGISKKRIKTE